MLLCRTEFNVQVESRTSVALAYRANLEEELIPRSRVLFGVSRAHPPETNTDRLMQAQLMVRSQC